MRHSVDKRDTVHGECRFCFLGSCCSLLTKWMNNNFQDKQLISASMDCQVLHNPRSLVPRQCYLQDPLLKAAVARMTQVAFDWLSVSFFDYWLIRMSNLLFSLHWINPLLQWISSLLHWITWKLHLPHLTNQNWVIFLCILLTVEMSQLNGLGKTHREHIFVVELKTSLALTPRTNCLREFRY